MDRYKQREGEPGHPGELGVDGGGQGGTGGHGGRGGHDHNAFLWVIMIIMTALIIGPLITTIHITHNANKLATNTNKIATLERQHNEQQLALIMGLKRAEANSVHDIQLIRQTDYRLCVRGQVTRAVININDKREHRQILLPLYNCNPDKIGFQAIRLNAQQTKAFEQWVATSKHLP